jgi:hypothetical protein
VSEPTQQATLPSADAARHRLVRDLLRARDNVRTAPLTETVKANLEHLWKHGGRKGDRDMTPSLQPDSITVRPGFVVLPTDDQHGPVLPKLIQSRGLQLKLALLLLFDAQCRYRPGQSVRNVRRVTPHPDEDYLSWRQLALTAASSHRRPSNLRARQITEALRKLEEYDLLRIPRQPGGKRRIYSFGPDGKTTWQLQTEESNPDEHPDYLVPNPTPGTFRIPREFFTNLWIFALTDTEIAAYLTLTFLRWRFPAQHYARGVYLLDTHREDYFRLTRATWRATDFLHRFRLIDRAPSPGRDFRTGKVNNFNQRWAHREVMPSLFKINTEALRRPALNTIDQILTEPTDEDSMRRLYGQQFVDQQRNLILHRDADSPFTTPSVADVLGIRI